MLLRIIFKQNGDDSTKHDCCSWLAMKYAESYARSAKRLLSKLLLNGGEEMGLTNDDPIVRYLLDCRKSLMASTLEQEPLTVLHQDGNIFSNVDKSLLR